MTVLDGAYIRLVLLRGARGARRGAVAIDVMLGVVRRHERGSCTVEEGRAWQTLIQGQYINI